MPGIITGLFRILWPALMEWLKSKKLGPKSDTALKEINQMFIMFILLVVIFFASVEHGISIYSSYTEKLREAAWVRRDNEILELRVAELREHNIYLRSRYRTALNALENFADEDPEKIIRSMEDSGTIPKSVTPPPSKPN